MPGTVNSKCALNRNCFSRRLTKKAKRDLDGVRIKNNCKVRRNELRLQLRAIKKRAAKAEYLLRNNGARKEVKQKRNMRLCCTRIRGYRSNCDADY